MSLYVLGQLGFISWVPEYAEGLGMSLNDAGTLVSNFWMSCVVGMSGVQLYSSLLLPDLQRVLTVLAGLAAILMYVFNTGTPAHMAWSILALGLLLQRDLYHHHHPGFTADQSTVAKTG